MIYLTNFIFPSNMSEERFLHEYYGQDALASSYHTNMYPFRTLSDIGLFRMEENVHKRRQTEQNKLG